MENGKAGVNSERFENVTKTIGEKIIVFENAEDGHVDDDTEGEEEFPKFWILLPVDPEGAEIVEKAGEQEEEDETKIPPAVENVTGDEQ